MSDRYEVGRHTGGSPARRAPEYAGSGDARRARTRGAGPDGGSDLHRYREILARRSRIAIWTFILVVAAVTGGTLLQDPVYRATGLLEIRTPSSEIATTEGLFSSDRVSATMLGTEQGLLTSPALARRVVTDLELHRLDRFREDPAPMAFQGAGGSRAGSPAAMSERELQVATVHFQERLTVHPMPESRLVQVSFDDVDPVMAARIVNATVSNYSGMRLDGGERAAEWLGLQMDSARQELESAEERLQAYAAEHDLPYVVNEDLSPQLRERVLRLQDDLAEAEARRYERESRHDLVVRGDDYEAVEDRVVEGLVVRLAELRREYAGVAATFTDDYPPALQLRRQIEEVERLLQEERGRIVRVIESEYELALRQEQALRSALEQERSTSDALMRRAGPYHLLRGEVMANRELYASLQRQRDQARVSAALDGAGVGIVDLAVPPSIPHRPKLAHNLALAIIAGLVMGVGGAFLREFFDDTVQTGDGLATLSDIPVLALIPSVESADRLTEGSAGRLSPSKGGRLLEAGGEGNGENGGGWPRPQIDSRIDEGSARESLMEAFATLRTAVLYRTTGPDPRTILVSSCKPGEGKTTVCLNLGISMRRGDQRVLIVDADLRRSGINRVLGIPSRPGLADHLREGGDWRSFVRSDRSDSGPHILPSGGPVSDARDLLSNPRMASLIEEAGREYDIVLLDAPALFVNAPDARILSQLVPHVLLVARSGETPNSLFSAVLEATPNALGIVVNGLDVGRLPGPYREFFTPYPERSASRGLEAGPSEPSPERRAAPAAAQARE